MAIGFKLDNDPNPTIFKNVKVSSQAVTIGDALMEYNTGSATKDVDPATSATTTYGIKAVAVETVTSAATQVLAILVTPFQTWSADTTNPASTSHNNQKMVLTDKSTVNNTGTTSTAATAIFEQEGTLPFYGTTRITGRFLKAYNVTA